VLLAWALYLPAYGLFAVAGSLPVALAAGLVCGVGQGSSWVLINSAAQEEVPDRYLGRVTGLVSLVHRGAHATGLLLVSPLFAFVAAPQVFAAAAVAIPLTGLAGLAFSARAAEARTPETSRTRQS
jgi:MFS-type transporter involved in bile tolerance (Atg22 family)